MKSLGIHLRCGHPSSHRRASQDYFLTLPHELRLWVHFICFTTRQREGESGEARRKKTQVWRGVRPLLSSVTPIVSQAAEVRWDAAVGESEGMLTALVNLFPLRLCDLCGWEVSVERAEQRETLRRHLSVRGDPGRVQRRQACAQWGMAVGVQPRSNRKHTTVLQKGSS